MIKKHFKEYLGYNEKLQRHEVAYIFYGGLPKKWREDTAYLTSEELGKIKYERGENEKNDYSLARRK